MACFVKTHFKNILFEKPLNLKKINKFLSKISIIMEGLL